MEVVEFFDQLEDRISSLEKRLANADENNQPEWVTGLDWLSQETGYKDSKTLRNKILYPYKDEISAFAVKEGKNWRFCRVPMKNWLRKNFKNVNKGK